jgi:S-adenosylmethionine uptake transporter
MNRQIALPFLVACLGIAIFSVMDAFMKGLSMTLGAYNAMLWRLMAGIILAGIIFALKGAHLPGREALRLHMMRGVIAAGMAVAFFWGLARVPMAEAIALSFIAPLITLYLAAVLLGETIGKNAIFASVLGLIGVMVILSDKAGGSLGRDAWAGVAAIMVSAVLYAWNLILQRQQAQVASPFEIAFFQNCIAGGTLALFAPFFAVVPETADAVPILISAALALVSLLLLSWAYARAEAQILVTVEYTAFVWAAILGWAVFDERVTIATLIGAVLIVVGCLIATRKHPDHVETTAL